MAPGALEDETSLRPDDAFATLGNEIRMDILQTLGEATEPLTFSELRARVDVRDSGQFSYHLDKLIGHFVRKRESTYEISEPGRRVVQAVLSGAVTNAPVVNRTEIDVACPHCDAPVEVRYVPDRVEFYCTVCSGTVGRGLLGDDDPATEGFIGRLALPPAGLHRRTPDEMAQAAATWGNLRFFAVASRVCPHCSAPLDVSPSVCANHDAANELCERCSHRYAVRRNFRCLNCFYAGEGSLALALRTEPALLEFQLEHGLNPVAPQDLHSFARMLLAYDEALRSTDPLVVELTFSLGGDAITLTVDDELDVVRVRDDRAED